MKKILSGFIAGGLVMATVQVIAGTNLVSNVLVSQTATQAANISICNSGLDAPQQGIKAVYQLQEADGTPLTGNAARVDIAARVDWTDSNSDGVMDAGELGDVEWIVQGEAVASGLLTPSCPSGAGARTAIANHFNSNNSAMNTLAGACFN